jgi:hypothetical protein
LVGWDDGTHAFDVFISYARADQDVVTPFVTALKRDNFSVWIDYEQMAGGPPVYEQLTDGATRSSHMIVCLTDSYLQRDWTRGELQISLTRDPSGREVRTIPAIFRPLTLDIPLYLSRLSICDLSSPQSYEQQYALVTKMIRRQVTSTTPNRTQIGEICSTPFDHANDPERALFEAYQAYRELCQFLYRREFGELPPHASFRWLTEKLLMGTNLPSEIRLALATMETYGKFAAPGHVDSPTITAETIDPALTTLATLTAWAFPEWDRPDQRVALWESLPPHGDDDTRHLPGTDYVLRAPALGRTTLGPLHAGRDTSRDAPVSVVLVEAPVTDEHAFRQHVTRFQHVQRGGVLVPGDAGEFAVGERRQHYLTLPAIDGVSARDLIAHSGELPERGAYELALGVAEALRGLHEADPPVVHGDITIANVFVGSLGTVTLCPGRPAADTKTADLAALASLVAELYTSAVTDQLASATSAARACQVLQSASRELPSEDSLGAMYRRYRKATTPAVGPPSASRVTALVETGRIESRAAWPLGGGRLLVWERGSDTLVVLDGSEPLWRDLHAVPVRRVAHGPDGRLAIGGWDGTVRCFADGALVVTARLDGAIGDLCFAGDSVVAGSWKHDLGRFGPDGSQRQLLGVAAGVHRIAVADSGDRFAVADLSGGLAIYAGERRVSDLPALGFVTDLAYAGTRLVLLTGAALTSIRLDGTIGAGEAKPGARQLLPGPAPGHCTLLVDTSAGMQTWLIDEADRHVRASTFPPGHVLVDTCTVPGRFIASDPDGGFGYWRDGERQFRWRDAATATLSRDGRLIAVSRPGVVELYEDFA